MPRASKISWARLRICSGVGAGDWDGAAVCSTLSCVCVLAFLIRLFILIQGLICFRYVSQSFRKAQRGQSPWHFAEMAQRHKKNAAKLTSTKPQITNISQFR